MTGIDWKKVANVRLKELRRLQACDESLRLNIQQELRRELFTHLQARCISRPGEIADEISIAVATRLTPNRT